MKDEEKKNSLCFLFIDGKRQSDRLTKTCHFAWVLIAGIEFKAKPNLLNKKLNDTIGAISIKVFFLHFIIFVDLIFS